MRGYLTLTRRELGGYFLTLTGYIIIAAATFLMSFSFVVLMAELQHEPSPMPLTELFYVTYFFWLVLLLSTPVITMRLFAQERFSGTYETLMTTPVTDRQVVLAKFTGALLFYCVMWLPLLGCLWVVRDYAATAGVLDWGAVGGTYLGIVLLGSLYLSMGCCASALTRSQVSAAMMSLAFGAGIFFVAWLADYFPNQATWQAQLLAQFDFFQQMHDFVRGIIDTRWVVFLLTLSFFFLFLNLRIIESRRWK
jgi:gliding motility-associated transport system permease protein